MREVELSIITINYNGIKDTCALLESIPSNDESLEVIVVDNHSAEDEASEIEKRYPGVTVIRSEYNLGFAGGNNLGIQASHGRYLLFINNDTVTYHPSELATCCSPQFFQPLIERLKSSDTIGAVCPKLRFFWDDAPIQFAGYTRLSPITLRNRAIGSGKKDCGQYSKAHPTPYLHGAAMMVKREAIEKAGMMPECYFLYYEEYDWSMMLRRAGYTLWYDPAVTIYHKESCSTGKASTVKTYYLTRNRLLLAKRNIIKPLRYLTYLYLFAVVFVRDYLKTYIKGDDWDRWTLRRAYGDFIKGYVGWQPI